MERAMFGPYYEALRKCEEATDANIEELARALKPLGIGNDRLYSISMLHGANADRAFRAACARLGISPSKSIVAPLASIIVASAK